MCTWSCLSLAYWSRLCWSLQSNRLTLSPDLVSSSNLLRVYLILLIWIIDKDMELNSQWGKFCFPQKEKGETQEKGDSETEIHNRSLMFENCLLFWVHSFWLGAFQQVGFISGRLVKQGTFMCGSARMKFIPTLVLQCSSLASTTVAAYGHFRRLLSG